MRRKKYLKILLRLAGSRKRLLEVLGAEIRRRNHLQKDAVFIRETEALQEGFEAASLSKPKTVDAFLRRFKIPSPFLKSKAKRFLDATPSKMAGLFKKYRQYATRFGVYFIRKGESFEWRVMAEFGWKFRVNQRDGHLEATEYVPEGNPRLDFFEAPSLQIPAPFQALIDTKVAKFVQIDDTSGTFAFNELEQFSYYDRGLTFIVHNAEQPYLYCLIGEKATKELWGKAGTSISAFQRQFGRGKGGRPTTNVELRKVMREALKQPGRKKEKAIELIPDVATTSGQSYLSRVAKRDRERAARIAKMKREFDSDK